MRSIWKGSVSFGLVSIPVRLYVATEDRDLQFHLLHSECHTRVSYRRYCPACEEEVPKEELVRGYEFEPGQYVVLTDEEIAGATGQMERSIAIEDFVDLREIDPIYYQKTYYLEPREGGNKPYALLCQAMEQAGKVAVGSMALRRKPHLVALRVRQNVLTMETMFYADEVRDSRGLAVPTPEQVAVHPNERRMAVQLIDNLAVQFHPEKYANQYRDRLLDIIQAKIRGEEIAVAPPDRPARVINLMDALRQSLEEAQQKRGGGAEWAPIPPAAGQDPRDVNLPRGHP